MCCNISTFVGGISSSHNLKSFGPETSTALNMRLRAGYTHDFVTSEQFRSDFLFWGIWPMISSINSCGRSIVLGSLGLRDREGQTRGNRRAGRDGGLSKLLTSCRHRAAPSRGWDNWVTWEPGFFKPVPPLSTSLPMHQVRRLPVV